MARRKHKTKRFEDETHTHPHTPTQLVVMSTRQDKKEFLTISKVSSILSVFSRYRDGSCPDESLVI